MKKLFTLLLAGCMMASCSSKNNFDVDVSGVDARVDLQRLDLDIASVIPDSLYSSLPGLKAKYGDFFDLYVEDVVNLGNTETASFQSSYEDFYNWCSLNSVFADVQKEFPPSDNLQSMFEEGFRHFKHYFPSDSLPKIYTIISGFQESVFPSDNLIAIALDKYLGERHSMYERVGIDVYKRRRMCKEMMQVDYFKTIAMLKFPKSEQVDDNLLNEMIYKGRIGYFLKSMMPSVADSLLWGYSDYQYRWAETYESNVWTYLIERKLLFERNPRAIQNLTGEGPFTNAFGNQSAPGVASFCGFGIVCSFMRRNPDVTLEQLMRIEDLNSIYTKSRYNP